jgi:uncharacterized protein (DUF433 family)
MRGLRIPFQTVAAGFRSGMTVLELLHDFPDLEKEDIDEGYGSRKLR